MAKRYTRPKKAQQPPPQYPPLTDFSKWCAGLTPAVDLQIRNYQNNADLTQPLSLANLVECNYFGYARVLGRHFTLRGAKDGFLAYASTGICTYVKRETGGGNTVYGWYVVLVDSTPGGFGEMVLYADPFPQPIAMVNPNDSFSRIYAINSTFASVPRPPWYQPGSNTSPRNEDGDLG